MKLQKNFFYLFATLAFSLAVFFSVACVIGRLGAGQEYPYFLKGVFVLIFLGLSVGILLLGMFWARLDIRRRLMDLPVLTRIAEGLCAALLLIIGTILRVWVIKNLPMAPESDYKTYYEIADLISRGVLLTEGPGYCDYVSMFPHVFGYPAVLSFVFRIFGTSVTNALVFNLVCSIGNCILVWRIVRNLSGRLSALFALALEALWPSQILYSSFVASEALFSFLLLLAIHIFVISLKETPLKEKNPWTCTLELVLLGFVLAFGAFVRPMATILLVAILLCLISGEKLLPPKPKNDLPLGLRASNKGWKRCITILAVYMFFSHLFSSAASYAVDRELAGGSASYGYNLLVGLNLDTYGGWNQDDADYLYAALDRTGSANEAQLACRDMALVRLRVDPRALINLFMHKFEVLWGNDDFGSSWNILFMDQQGNLTPWRSTFLYQMMDIGDLFYICVLLLAGIGGCIMLARDPDGAYCCTLLVCGTVVLHLLVENQNRYHYHAMPMLAIIAGTAVGYILRRSYHHFMYQREEKDRLNSIKAARAAEVAKLQETEDELSEIRAQALHAQFDMGSALREGHIQIIASQSAVDAAPGEADAAPEEAGAVQKDAATTPEETEAVSEEAAAVPEETETVSEEAAAVPEETEAVSEEVAAVPEETEAVSEEAAIVPDKTDVVTEQAEEHKEDTDHVV